MAVPVALILGAAQLAMGAASKAKSKREAERLRNSRPEIGESAYTQDALKLAQSELAGGVGEIEQFYDQGIDRNLSSSLGAILKGGGSVNNVADVFDASQEGRKRLLMISENLRMNRINNLYRVQLGAEDQRQQRFQFNEFAPWADAAQANAQARMGASAQMNQGLNTAGAGLMQWQQDMAANQDYNNYLRSDRFTGDSTGQNFSANTSSGNAAVNTPDVGYINPDYASGIFNR